MWIVFVSKVDLEVVCLLVVFFDEIMEGCDYGLNLVLVIFI